MAFAFKRSIRQLISGVIAVVVGYTAWQWSGQAGIFYHTLQGAEIWGPYAAGIAGFFASFYIAMMLLKSKAAR
jgi:hypothetical protein